MIDLQTVFELHNVTEHTRLRIRTGGAALLALEVTNGADCATVPLSAEDAALLRDWLAAQTLNKDSMHGCFPDDNSTLNN